MFFPHLLGYIPYLVPPPTPPPAPPPPPENVTADLSCSYTTVCTRRWPRNTCVQWGRRWEVNIILTWEDKADNETGYEIYKDGIIFASLQADTTEHSDWFRSKQFLKGTNLYTIQAFNQAGASIPVEIRVDYLCPKYQ